MYRSGISNWIGTSESNVVLSNLEQTGNRCTVIKLNQPMERLADYSAVVVWQIDSRVYYNALLWIPLAPRSALQLPAVQPEVEHQPHGPGGAEPGHHPAHPCAEEHPRRELRSAGQNGVLAGRTAEHPTGPRRRHHGTDRWREWGQ